MTERMVTLTVNHTMTEREVRAIARVFPGAHSAVGRAAFEWVADNPKLPDEPPVGTVIGWLDGGRRLFAYRTAIAFCPWQVFGTHTYQGPTWHTWGEIVKRADPDTLVVHDDARVVN